MKLLQGVHHAHRLKYASHANRIFWLWKIIVARVSLMATIWSLIAMSRANVQMAILWLTMDARLASTWFQDAQTVLLQIQFRIFEFMTFWVEPDSALCDYMKYMVPGNSTSKSRCFNCAQKWDGCSQCGIYGDQCTTCFQTHLFTNQTHFGYATDSFSSNPTPATSSSTITSAALSASLATTGVTCINAVIAAIGKGSTDSNVLGNYCTTVA